MRNSLGLLALTLPLLNGPLQNVRAEKERVRKQLDQAQNASY